MLVWEPGEDLVCECMVGPCGSVIVSSIDEHGVRDKGGVFEMCLARGGVSGWEDGVLECGTCGVGGIWGGGVDWARSGTVWWYYVRVSCDYGFFV